MATYSVAQRRCVANQTTVSPSVTVPATVTGIDVQLTSSEWDTVVGTLVWGIERCDDGVNWSRWIFTPGEGYPPMPIGSTYKGRLPMIGVSATQVMTVVGTQVRLFALPSATIRLGAQITTVE